LLEALIDGAGNKNNNCIRQLCANAIGEFTNWRIKNLTADEIKNNPIMIRQLMRRIDYNSNHPCSYKRLSTVLCLIKFFEVI